MILGSAKSVRRVHLHGGGVVRIGARVVLDTSIAPIELHVERGAEIVIGDDVYVAGGTSMEAQRSIRIGARACIGAFTKILDGHFHALEGDRHVRPPPSVVIVEEDVTIGPRCVLLPRAHIGRGSSLGAGTVASRRFPPHVALAGVPAAIRGKRTAP
ncbi:MAG TPA: hypothetical protein VGH28_30990 [Polyangiaceae bacterium]|jgi:acetyltransferase-like isoleucine patch superfamily enzyme